MSDKVRHSGRHSRSWIDRRQSRNRTIKELNAVVVEKEDPSETGSS
ncbi:MAG: hypothetical protein ABGX83_05970 [Nitrospira sp.]